MKHRGEVNRSIEVKGKYIVPMRWGDIIDNCNGHGDCVYKNEDEHFTARYGFTTASIQTVWRKKNLHITTHSTCTSSARVTFAKLSKFPFLFTVPTVNRLDGLDGIECSMGLRSVVVICPNICVLFIQTHYLPSCISLADEN